MEKNCWHRHPYTIKKWWLKNQATYQNQEEETISASSNEDILLPKKQAKTICFDGEPRDQQKQQV